MTTTPTIPILMTSPIVDVLVGKDLNKKLFDHGYVQLVDVMPRLVSGVIETPSMDEAIVNAARTSYTKGTRTVNDNRSLIRYMMRHKHRSPFEMPKFQFMVKATLDVIAQWRRHRTCTFVNWNQESLRYSEASDDFYVPDVLRPQSSTNKQGRDDSGIIDAVSQQKFKDLLRARKPHQEYSTALEAGIARETARLILPTNLYSTFVFTVDLSNLLNFLQLRVDPHAQYEIRQYALAIYELVEPLVPLTIAAWEDYELNAISFSVPELAFLMDSQKFRSGLDSLDWDDKLLLKDCGLVNQRELSELKTKINKMFDYAVDSEPEPDAVDTGADDTNDDRPISPYGSGSDSESSTNECDSDCDCTECTMLLQRKHL